MIFDSIPPPPRPEVEFSAESSRREIASRWVSDERPIASKAVVGELETRYLRIEGGNLLLRLETPTKFQLRSETMECEVLGWDLVMPVSELNNLPRAMARRFLDLLSKAEDDRLSDVEAETWTTILDQVDYTSFSIDRSAPHYMEGKLIRHKPDCRVEWHDGEKQLINPNSAAALSNLDPGELFGAFIKLGSNNQVCGIERISKLAEF